MVRSNITLYTKKLEGGETIELNKTFIDNKGSYEQFFTGIYDLYDKPPEKLNNSLVGQLIWNDQYIVKVPYSAYAITKWTVFLKDGSIGLEYNTLNWSPITLEPFIATIKYGTGKYLGATGYMVIKAKEVQLDPCEKVNNYWTVEGDIIFTN